MRRIMLGGALTALSVAILPASAYAQSAAQAKVSGCRGLAEKDAAGYAGITPNERKVSLAYALTTRSAADDALKDQVRLATHRVEVCYLEAQVLVCPADGDDRWLIYDASVKPDGLDGVPIQDFDANDDDNVAYVTLPIDFLAGTLAGRFLVLRVNELVDVLSSGLCPVPQLLHQSTYFRLVGVPTGLVDPLGLVGPCTPAFGAVPTATHCYDPANYANLLDWLERMDAWITDSMGVGLWPAPLALPLWSSGYDASGGCVGGYCPGFVFVTNHRVGGESLGTGGVVLDAARVSDLLAVDQGTGRHTAAHEYFHQLQWASVFPDHPRILGMPFAEGTADAVRSHACSQNYPGALDPTLCVSPGRLGAAFGTAGHTDFFERPWNEGLSVPYDSAVYWRHFVEQFAMESAVDAIAHPSATNSLRSIDQVTADLVLGDPARFPDEGLDLLVKVVEAVRGGAGPAMDAVDQVLRTQVGRSFEAMLVDMHTAAVLKDYRDTSRRWRFEWVGDQMAGAAAGVLPTSPAPAAPLSGQRPFATSTYRWFELDPGSRPAILVNGQPWTGPDELPSVQYAWFEQDFTVAGGMTHILPRVLNAYGAEYFWFGTSNPANADQTLRLRLRPGTLGVPYLRLFTVDSSDNVAVLERCADMGLGGADAFERCASNVNGEVEVYIPIGAAGAQLKGILGVVSAGVHPASYYLQLGAGTPLLAIWEPAWNFPAYIGQPGAATGSFPFLARFVVGNDDQVPIAGLQKSELRLTVTDPTTGVVNQLAETDFELMDLTGGSYLARVTVPPAFFPVADASLTFTMEYLVGGVSLATWPATEALTVSAVKNTRVSTQLVVDHSESMIYGDGSKLQALKDATKFLVDTLVDGDEFGLVLFDQDASTPLGLTEVTPVTRDALRLAIDGVIAAGCTSMGDGLFEAASNFAQKYDEAPDPSVRQHLVVLSDGINNSDLVPGLYHDPTTEGDRVDNSDPPGTTCGLPDPNPGDSLPWYGGTLEWYARKANGLAYPRVSAIALGQDADLVALSNLSRDTDGSLMWAPGTGAADELGATAQALEDGFRAAATKAMGWSRLVAGTTTVPSYLPKLHIDEYVSTLQVHYSLRESAPDPNRVLLDPAGSLHAPVHVTDRAAVFRVSYPIPGEWEFVGGGPLPPPSSPGPRVYVEAIGDGPLVLLVAADVDTARGAETPAERGNFVGKDVYLRAIPTEGGQMLGVDVVARITHPDGSVATVALADDGLSGDGKADDGTYGAVLRDLNLAGAYNVRFSADGTTPLGYPFTREATQGFVLEDAPDGDGDGVPDFRDPNPGFGDSAEDPDGDGLTNSEEFWNHTQATIADSDYGGENDGSEVAQGGNPFDPQDDAIDDYLVYAQGCNGEVVLRTEVPATHASLQVERAPGIAGPFTQVYDGPVPADQLLTLPAVNDEKACYRARSTDVQGRVGNWSPPHCTRSAEDPILPEITSLALDSGHNWTRSSRVMITVSATDGGPELPIVECENAVTSGVTDIIYSPSGDFEGAEWEPFTDVFAMDLPQGADHTGVFVRVRDAAGNESDTAYVPIRQLDLGIEDVVIYGAEQVKINDRAVVFPGDAGPAIVNGGPTETNIGAESQVQNIWSVPRVFLRSNSTTHGFVETAGLVELQDGATVEGDVNQYAVFDLPPMPTVSFSPSSRTDWINIEPGRTRTLAPGEYGYVAVKSWARLNLRAGEYTFRGLQVEPDGIVMLNKAAGPVTLNVSEMLNIKSEFDDLGGLGADTLVQYSGTQGVYWYGDFDGTIVAPNAYLYLGTSGALDFTGAFFAKAVEVHPDARIVHAPMFFLDE